MAKRTTICNHADTDDTLIIAKGREYNKYTVLRQAVLVQTCKDCNVEINQYVAGGVLFQAKEG
jgi:hypothetical protein